MKTISGHNSESISKQECISYLSSWKETLKDRIKQGDPRKRLYEEQIIFLNKAVKELEKQIPKKVTHEASLPKCCTCPTCKNVIDKFEQFGESNVRIEYNYCPFCGQKLDWE